VTIFLPSHFSVADEADRESLAREVIAANPFATLVGHVDGELFVTHCPIIVQPTGLVLEGHVSRGNRHWRAWQGEGADVIAIFHGPHGYVSPTWYEGRENVPTWNYVAVHATGRATAIDDAGAKHDLLKRLIRVVEPAYEAQWNELDDGYQQRMLGGMVGVRIVVERLEAKFKLSQNRLPGDRQRVRQAFARGDGRERALADWMQRLGA
jgi:transcriptional regulator